MQRIIIPIQPIQHRRLLTRLILPHHIRRLALRRRKILRLRTLRPTPTSLPDKKRTPNRTHIDLISLSINNIRLSLQYSSRFPFIIDTNDFIFREKFPAGGAGGEGFVEDHFAFAVEDACAVELGHVGDGGARVMLCGVEVDDFLRGMLEGEDDGVGWEDGEVGVEFL